MGYNIISPLIISYVIFGQPNMILGLSCLHIFVYNSSCLEIHLSMALEIKEILEPLFTGKRSEVKVIYQNLINAGKGNPT